MPYGSDLLIFSGVLFGNSGQEETHLGRQRRHEELFLPRAADKLQRRPLEATERAAQGGELDAEKENLAGSTTRALKCVGRGLGVFLGWWVVADDDAVVGGCLGETLFRR